MPEHLDDAVINPKVNLRADETSEFRFPRIKRAQRASAKVVIYDIEDDCVEWLVGGPK